MNELTPDEQGMLVDAIHDSATVIHKGRRMNERIEKLITQARGHWNNGDFNMPSSVEFQAEDIEKFAELIVRECICQCDDENSQKYIMSHFGFTEKDWS